MKSKKEFLLLRIEYSRKKLVLIGNEFGFTNPETIKWSQKLDKLILKYQKLQTGRE